MSTAALTWNVTVESESLVAQYYTFLVLLLHLLQQIASLLSPGTTFESYLPSDGQDLDPSQSTEATKDVRDGLCAMFHEASSLHD